MPTHANPSFLEVPCRSDKPRKEGITHVLDKGLTLAATHELLCGAGRWIDIWKFGWGVAYIDPWVKEKVQALTAAGVHSCTGGTLLEIAWRRGAVDAFFDYASEVGFSCVEVSNGATSMPLPEKRNLIVQACKRGFNVLAEVGSKDPAKQVTADQWLDEMSGDLRAGATWLVAEGRESGTVGLYQDTGHVREALLLALAGSPFANRILYEAPQRAQQAMLLRLLGPEVNLGNIALDEVVTLETLRLGLRADTLDAFDTWKAVNKSLDGQNQHVLV
jgi:phosphosulfolactate synthase